MPGPGAYWFGQEEIDAVTEVARSGHLFRYGKEGDARFLHKVATLEHEFARYCGCTYVLGTSSGTSALLSAAFGLGLQPGDEIIVPAYTFIASYSAMTFMGIVPVLAEIDKSLTLDPDDIEHRITPRTRAIMPVHMLGNPCDMDRIMAVANKHNLLVLEDCCQAAGASYKGRKVGTIGHCGAFSLNFFKTISSGDGGLVATNDAAVYEAAFAMHDQGHKPSRLGVEVGARSVLGLNFRMTELAGAVALAQLRKLDRIVATLRSKRALLKNAIINNAGVTFRTLNDPAGDCATLCTVLFESPELAKQVTTRLGSKTVDQSGWHVYSNMEHLLRYLEARGLPHAKGAYPRTDDILSRAMNISVGVVDGGLGAGWGINIDSTEDEIAAAADEFNVACAAVNGVTNNCAGTVA